MSLPQRLPIERMQTTWATQLDPVVNFAPNQGLLLKNIALDAGVNVVNHLLGKNMQGWIIIDQNASASIYRSQPMNNLTITLTSNAPVTVSMWVF